MSRVIAKVNQRGSGNTDGQKMRTIRYTNTAYCWLEDMDVAEQKVPGRRNWSSESNTTTTVAISVKIYGKKTQRNAGCATAGKRQSHT